MKVINSAKEVMFLVSGIEKAQAVSDALTGVGNLPAGDVSGLMSTLWLLDEAAASVITSS
jgi:6-phosphogluconolactonase/glucosamine-6-phosphate isomerase/deaminase